MAEKKRPSSLGRGLSALLEEAAPTPAGGAGAGISVLAIADILPDPDQPRRRFDADALDELSTSIREHGLLQPILVRPLADGRYQLIAGERRWRASQRAGLHEVPVIVRNLDARSAFEVALIENVQRTDLSAIEEARGYRRLLDEFGHTQEQLARIVGKARSHLANMLRLLDLPAPVQAMVDDGRLSLGHAKAIAAASNPEALANKVVRDGLSVRATEKLAAAARPAKPRNATLQPDSARHSTDADALEVQLAEALGMPVSVSLETSGHSGSLSIRFADLDQLDWLCARLGQGGAA
jgi:ParB family chromosome partitioning protein